MKRKGRGIPLGMWVLLALLGVSAVVITLGARDPRTQPFSTSYSPSGTRALVELLQKNGYRVRSDRSTITKIRPNELAIFFFDAQTPPQYWDDVAEDRSPIASMTRPHLERGGRTLAFYFEDNFVDASSRMAGLPPQTVQTSDGRTTFKIRTGLANTTWADVGMVSPDATLWTSPIGPFAALHTVGDGQAVHVADGIFATNRFIDQEEHAAAVLALVAVAAQGSKEIVFLDAGFGAGGAPSLMERIGPWATGAWTQVTLIFIAAVLAWGIRFGFPMRERFVQRGGRELVDAYATMLQRTKSHTAALQMLHDSADVAVRNRLKMARDTDQDVVDRAMPEPLMMAFREARNALKSSPPEAVVFRVVQSLDRHVAEFLGHTDRRPARRRKS